MYQYADQYVSEYRVSLAERKKEKSRFLKVSGSVSEEVGTSKKKYG